MTSQGANGKKPRRRRQLSLFRFVSALLLMSSVTLAGCLTDHQPSIYYGSIVVPRDQEFRWSDGGLPQTFDPAFAAAPPDTDAVRALFEGLTDYDPKTLAPVPGVATRWESSADGRVWTFYLRDDAKWSNGEAVTASDFVKSWERTLKIGPLAPHTELLSNIEGSGLSAAGKPTNESTAVSADAIHRRFGAEAVSEHVLRVRLSEADSDFPALVSHPVFRPVKISGTDITHRIDPHDLVSNGAFQLAKSDNERVLLERADTYWDGASIALQKVSFVASTNAENALQAYRAGELDAVTNAPFEPLALKLLTGYEDFRRSTYGALTYYSFNTSRPPFDDIRVREALALAINRERVSRDHLGGATEPAGKFFPDAMSEQRPVIAKADLLVEDINKARALLAEAGFPNGDGFPVIRLLVNRNDQQRIVAQAVASMWESALNIRSEIILKNWDEYEASLKAGDFDVVRRGAVLQTIDELTNLKTLFERETIAAVTEPTAANSKPTESAKLDRPLKTSSLTSEREAMKELRAAPIYFASSYALVKPYVSGFDSNVLDAPSLKTTRINTAWVIKKP